MTTKIPRHYSVNRPRRRLVQTRVLTDCPLCGFRQRVDRLTGAKVGVTEDGDFLRLEVAAVYAYPVKSGLWCELHPVKLPDAARVEMYRAMAAKLLPLVRILQATVPEFADAIRETVEITVSIERVVPVQFDVTHGIKREREVAIWSKPSVERTVPVMMNVPTPPQRELRRWQKPTEIQVPVEMGVQREP